MFRKETSASPFSEGTQAYLSLVRALLPPGPGAWESADSGKNYMAPSQISWQFSRGFEVYSVKTGQSGLRVEGETYPDWGICPSLRLHPPNDNSSTWNRDIKRYHMTPDLVSPHHWLAHQWSLRSIKSREPWISTVFQNTNQATHDTNIFFNLPNLKSKGDSSYKMHQNSIPSDFLSFQNQP